MFSEAQRQGVSASAFSRLIAINCEKISRNIPLLYRNVIFQKCEELVERHREIEELSRETGQLVEATIDEARVVYQEHRGFSTLLWCRGKSRLEYDASTNQIVAGIDGVAHCFPPGASLTAGDHSAEIAELFSASHTYWGKVFEEIMK